MKIKNLSIICDAMSNLINACMDANITTDEIRRLSEMDNEFALCVNNISKMFTVDIKNYDATQYAHNNNKTTDIVNMENTRKLQKKDTN